MNKICVDFLVEQNFLELGVQNVLGLIEQKLKIKLYKNCLGLVEEKNFTFGCTKILGVINLFMVSLRRVQIFVQKGRFGWTKF